VAELEAEIKEDKEKWKKESTDFKVEIHTLKNQLANSTPSSTSAPSGNSLAPDEPRSAKVCACFLFDCTGLFFTFSS
jgi:hypothetical protein